MLPCVSLLCSQANQFFQLIFIRTGPSSQLEGKVGSGEQRGAVPTLARPALQRARGSSWLSLGLSALQVCWQQVYILALLRGLLSKAACTSAA